MDTLETKEVFKQGNDKIKFVFKKHVKQQYKVEQRDRRQWTIYEHLFQQSFFFFKTKKDGMN